MWGEWILKLCLERGYIYYKAHSAIDRHKIYRRTIVKCVYIYLLSSIKLSGKVAYFSSNAVIILTVSGIIYNRQQLRISKNVLGVLSVVLMARNPSEINWGQLNCVEDDDSGQVWGCKRVVEDFASFFNYKIVQFLRPKL